MLTEQPLLDAAALDALTELMNIGVGRAAAALSDLVGERIELTVPRIRLCCDGRCEGIAPADAAATTVVMQSFQGRICGRAALAFPQSSALTLGCLLSGDDCVSTEVDAELNGILLEVGNIVLNGVLGSLSNLAGDGLEYSLPTLFDDHPTLARVLAVPETAPDLLIGDVDFQVQNREIHGTIAIVFGQGCVRRLLSSLPDPVGAVSP
jgi:chemotaxis protein CheC